MTNKLQSLRESIEQEVGSSTIDLIDDLIKETIKEKLKRALKEHKEYLNNGDYEVYREQFPTGTENEPISELVYSADFEGAEYSIMFEQGMMRAYENLLNNQ